MMGRPAFPRYRILDQIGAGGMGVVYRAEDTSLGRQVALKFLPAEFARRADLLTRFEREARAAAALNHPNICTIYEVGQIQSDEVTPVDSGAGPVPTGAHFIAMEYIHGKTLRSLIQGRPLPLRDALRISCEVAEGLGHAHHAGIVHRDLKPGNIMITAEGRAKLLDFGLAKLVQEAPSAPPPANVSEVSTLPTDVTRHGEIVGTSAYMSPEQARGLKVDHRSDTFSFGVVLYEMLTGRPPFTGPTRSDVMGAILKDQPAPASRANPEVPPELERILGKCLEKDPADRYQHTADLAVDLRKLRGITESASFRTPEPPPVQQRRWPVALGGVLALVAAVVITAMVVRGNARQMRAADLIGVAILPFSYEGPPEKMYLKDVVPLVLAEGIRSSASFQVAPFASSRVFEPDADANLVANQLGIIWVVSGNLSIDGESFKESLRATNALKPGATWSKEITGDLSTLVARSAAPSGELVSALGGAPSRNRESSGAHDPAAMEAYLRGVTLLEGWDVKKNAAEAETAFREAIAKEPSFAEAHAKLAIALLSRFSRTKDASVITQASEAAERAVSLAPSLPETHTALGLVELQKGRSAEAAESLEKALAMAPADDALARSVARAYVELGRDGDAEAMFQRAASLRPGFWGNYNSWASFCWKRGKLDRAIELFRKVIELHPESDLGYSNLAAVYISQGRHREAEPLLQAALKINPSVQTRNNLGTVYYAVARFQDAARAWETAASMAKDAMIYSNLGDAYRQLHRKTDTAQAYRKAIEMGRAKLGIDPSDAETRGMIANALAGSGRCVEARTEAAGASAGSHDNPTVAYYAAVAAAICEDHDAAVRYTISAIRGGVIADVKTNPDLASILKDPAVAQLVN